MNVEQYVVNNHLNVKIKPNAAKTQILAWDETTKILKIAVAAVPDKGDHNCATSPYETNIEDRYVLGKAFFRVPFLGYVKILFVKFINVFIGG